MADLPIGGDTTAPGQRSPTGRLSQLGRASARDSIGVAYEAGRAFR